MTHICIVGGGTAGWLAALWLMRLRKGYCSITVIESSKIGIIGTGEGTTGQFFNVVQNRWGNFGLDEADFMRATGATFKQGIRFHNWRGDQKSYIAPIDNTPAVNQYDDYVLLDHCLEHGPDKMHTSTFCGTLAERGLVDVHKNWSTTYGFHAYHFDGHAVGRYFKHIVEVDPNCRVIDAEVNDFVLDERGHVAAALLSNGQRITADYWIDATGFARIISKKLDQKWLSYSDHLLCDRALPFQIPYGPDEDVAALTEARAHSAGWQWQIPVRGRYGCGMVYSSAHQTADQAVAELSQHWGRDIVPIKEIRYDPGRLDQPFYRNVMHLGLSANFLEPLQATNIHLQLAQLQAFDRLLLRPEKVVTDPAIVRRASEVVIKTMDQFADLIQLHYRSGRTDTEFWRDNQQTALRPNVEYLQEISRYRWPADHDWDAPMWGAAGYGVFIYPMINYGYFDFVELAKTMPKFTRDYGRRWRNHIDSMMPTVLTNREFVHELKLKLQRLQFSPEYDNIKPMAQIPARPTLQAQGVHPLLRF